MMTVDRHDDFIAFCNGQPVSIFDEKKSVVLYVVVVANKGCSATTLANRIRYNNRKARAAGRRLVQKTKFWMKMHRWVVQQLGPQENSKLYEWRRLHYAEIKFGEGVVSGFHGPVGSLLFKK